MSRRRAVAGALCLCTVHALMELGRAPDWETGVERVLAWFTTLVAIAILARLAWSDEKLTTPSGPPTRMLLLASLPAATLASAAAIEAQVLHIPAGAFLWNLTARLEPPMELVVVGTRVSSALLAGVATLAAIRTVGGARAQGALIALQLAALACGLVFPSWGGAWLLLLLPTALVGTNRAASTLASVAFGGALTMWILSDHASLWAESLHVLDTNLPPPMGPPGLLTDPAPRPYHLGPGFLVMAWASASYHFLRRRRGGRAFLLVALASTLPLFAFHSSLEVLTRASEEGQSPSPELIFDDGGLVVGGLQEGACRWTPRADDTLESLFSRSRCDTVEIVGRGPSMRFHSRLSSLGSAFDLPAVRSVAVYYVGLERDGDALTVPSSPDVDISEEVNRMIAPDRDTLRPVTAVVLRMPAHTPAARALEWVGALWVRRVGVAFRVPESE